MWVAYKCETLLECSLKIIYVDAVSVFWNSFYWTSLISSTSFFENFEIGCIHQSKIFSGANVLIRFMYVSSIINHGNFGNSDTVEDKKNRS